MEFLPKHAKEHASTVRNCGIQCRQMVFNTKMPALFGGKGMVEPYEVLVFA